MSTEKKEFVNALTKTGKPRARFTLKCNWNDGRQFTYRSDDNLKILVADKPGYSGLSEIEGLLIKFKAVKDLAEEAKIFDNTKPRGSDLVMHYVFGKVMLNELFIPGKIDVKYTI